MDCEAIAGVRSYVADVRPDVGSRIGTETCSNIDAMEERARRIVETAVELAEKGGFEAVRLRDVAAHAGVALGTLYRRFHSKEDLLLAAMELETQDLRARALKRPPEGDTPFERVAGFFQQMTRALLRRPNLARALVRALATGEPALTQKVATFHTDVGALIIAALRGEPVGEVAAATEHEQQIANVLQQVWFSSLIGWSAGLHGQSAIVDATRTAARLLLENSAA
ncbi:MAG: TetR family transcriptional regulator [Myxococcales bacterium]|nr:TetR family transcriptional regulator [Myxococcales bacterium]